jgi:uncharacterized protein (TIRG00374 family)
MRAGVAKKVAISLAVGFACLWLAARKVDADELKQAFHSFDLFYLYVAIGVSLAIQLMRALRWKIELSPLAELRYGLVWQVIAVAYMVINVLPFRLGEPVRPVLMSLKSGLSISAIVGNWVFEKMMDTAAIVFFIHLTLVVTDLPTWAHKASAASLTAFSVMLLLVVGFWLKGEGFYNATLARLLPPGAREKTLHVLRNAREGLQILPNKALVATVFVVTLLLWFLPILSSYVLILGFGFDVPFSAALVVFVAISVGTALPAPPGMFGVIQIASVVALGLFGIPQAEALAFGIVLNAVQFFTLIAQGLVALPFAGVDIGEVTRTAVGGKQDESSSA